MHVSLVYGETRTADCRLFVLLEVIVDEAEDK